MHDKSIAELAARLRGKAFSSRELTQSFLERIERFNPSLNAFVTVTTERALEQAEVADRRIAAGEAGPLTGIPLGQKDIFCT
ncbi:MAG: Asp-tRNA(Asn)/Glu-tRNA(Gln) amidotransferase GatCAB subunit A, partial [Methylococcaceae bacterium]|nr:Asp-tRNA(Asn)/Glu-tRNA(Gln) amidotransferase GatCAB subunit A [Methylococcaceae bacterium]